jgi:hypothetical protein
MDYFTFENSRRALRGTFICFYNCVTTRELPETPIGTEISQITLMLSTVGSLLIDLGARGIHKIEICTQR